MSQKSCAECNVFLLDESIFICVQKEEHPAEPDQLEKEEGLASLMENTHVQSQQIPDPGEVKSLSVTLLNVKNDGWGRGLLTSETSLY